MDMKKRSAAIAEFKQSERKPKILLISLKAGGVGLNVRCHITTNHVLSHSLSVDKRQPCVYGEHFTDY